MLTVTLNAVFCFGATMLALQCWGKGWPFARHGWQMIQAQVAHPDYRVNVERRRAISEGGRFLLAGIGWLLGCGLLALAALYFGWLAFRLTYGL
jgi:hypothetical protein